MPPEDCRHYQHNWDELLYKHHFSSLLDSASDARTKARLLSASSSESGAWFGALPVPSLGTKLDNESLRIALGLRLGVPIVVEHTCVCGSKVDVFGTQCRGGSRILLRGGGTEVEVTPQCAKHTLRNAKHELSRGVWGHAPPPRKI